MQVSHVVTPAQRLPRHLTASCVPFGVAGFGKGDLSLSRNQTTVDLPTGPRFKGWKWVVRLFARLADAHTSYTSVDV